MIIESEQADGPCDNCDKGTATHGAVQQGATGRYCEVMWICKTCAIKWVQGDETQILTTQEARDKCNANPYGYADF